MLAAPLWLPLSRFASCRLAVLPVFLAEVHGETNNAREGGETSGEPSMLFLE